MKKLTAAGGMLAVLALLAACGSGADPGSSSTTSEANATAPAEETSPSSEESDATSSSQSGTAAPETSEEAQSDELAPPETAHVVVGMLPTVSSGPFYMAVDQGIFEKYGLDVEVVPAGTGAEAAAALTSDSIQFGYGSYVAFLQAQSSGLKFKVAAEMAEVGTGQTAVIVPEDSPIKTPQDLAGKKIAVQSLQNYGVLALRTTLEDAGVTPDQYELVPIPNKNTMAALMRGDVDATWLTEPYLTQGRSSEPVRDLLDPFVGKVAEFPSTGIFTSADFAAKNPNTVLAFRAAIADGSKAINADIDAFRHFLSEYTETEPGLAEEMSLPDYPEATDVNNLAIVEQLMQESGMLDTPVDVADWELDS